MSTGTTGYPDGQRVSQETLIDPVWSISGVHQFAQVSPWIYAGNYTSILAQLQSTTLPMIFQANWALDAAGVTLMGAAAVDIDNGIANFSEWLHPVLAPYVQFRVIPSPSSGTWTPSAYVFLSNQSRPRALTQPALYSFFLSSNIAAGASATIAAEAVASGSHGFYCHGGNQGVKVTIQFLSLTNGTWFPCAVYSVAANADDYREIILPASACRVLVANASATTLNTGVSLVGSQDR